MIRVKHCSYFWTFRILCKIVIINGFFAKFYMYVLHTLYILYIWNIWNFFNWLNNVVHISTLSSIHLKLLTKKKNQLSFTSSNSWYIVAYNIGTTHQLPNCRLSPSAATHESKISIPNCINIWTVSPIFMNFFMS